MVSEQFNRWGLRCLALPLWAVFICWPSWTFASSVSVQQDIASLDPPSLVQMLGAASFTQREAATARLLELGETAIPALEAGLASEDAEIKRRVLEILPDLRGNAAAGYSGEDAEQIRQWNRMSPQQRSTQFQSYISRGDVRLALLMAEELEEYRGTLFGSSNRKLNQLLLSALLQGRTEQIEAAMVHPLIREQAFADVVHFHQARGTLDDCLDQEIGRLKTTGKQRLPLEQVRPVLAALRMQHRFDDAREIAERIEVEQDRISYEQQLLLEQGIWTKVLQQSIDPAEVPRAPDLLMANACQRALLQFASHQQDALDETIESLRQQLKSAGEEKNEFAVEALRGQLLLIGLVTLDSSLVNEFSESQNQLSRFLYYLDNRDYQNAFNVIGLEEDFEQRRSWFVEKTDRLVELQKMVGSASPTQRRTREYRDLSTELTETRQILIQLVDTLATLGFNRQAELLGQQLIIAEAEKIPTRETILQTLMSHERNAAVWRILESGLEEQGVSNVCQTLFSNRFNGVRNFLDPISRAYPDPVDQLQVVAGIANSPLGTLSDFSLARELARYRSQVAFNSNGTTELYFGQIYELHGQLETSQKYLAEAAKMGASTAEQNLAETAYWENDYATAAQYYDTYWRRRRTANEAMVAAECWQRLAEQAEDGSQRTKYSQLAEQALYAAILSWRSRSVSIAGVVSTVDSMACQPQATWLLKANVYALGQSQITNESYRTLLAENLISEQVQQHRQAEIELTLELFSDLSTNNVAVNSLAVWSDLAKARQRAAICAAIADGDVQRATEMAVHYLQFSPADSTLVEQLAPVFREAGAEDAWQKVLDVVVETYDQLLAVYPNAAIHRNNFAWSYVCARQRMDEAERHAERALSLRPHNSSYLDTMAEVKFLQGKVEEAVDLSLRSRQASPWRSYYRKQHARFQRVLNRN